MSICEKIRSDFNLCDYKNLYNVKKIVFVNRDDVEDYEIKANILQNRISFKLKDGKKGFMFSYNGRDNVRSSVTKSIERGVTYYNHFVAAFLQGVEERELSILKQLDKSNYFATVLFNNGVVWVYGFGYGVRLIDLNYTTEGDLNLASNKSENYPPLIYISANANPEQDFNDLFENSEVVRLGDFNDDFNDDFY